MKKLLLTLLLVLCTVSLMAQGSDSTVVFKANFLKKEYQRYEVTKTLYTLHRRDTTELLRFGFTAEVVVEDSLENAYLLHWKLSKFTINTNDPNLQKLIALAQPVQLSYHTTKAGVFKELISGTTVASCLEAALPKVLEPYKDKNDSVSKEEVAKIYQLRESLESLLTGFMLQLHQFHGLGYTLGEIVTVPVEIVSPFSSKPLPGIQRKKLTDIEVVNQTATIAYATMLDMAGYRQILSDNLKEAMTSVKGLQQSEIGSAMMHLRTGWPLWSMNQREATAKGYTYGEQLEIQYKQPN